MGMVKRTENTPLKRILLLFRHEARRKASVTEISVEASVAARELIIIPPN